MCASYAAPVRVGKRSPFGGRGARELLFAQEPDRGGADVDRAPAGACLGSRAVVALCLAEDGDRAVVEVDVGVAQAEQLAAAEHREDRDRNDAGDVLRHPGADFLGSSQVRKRGSYEMPLTRV